MGYAAQIRRKQEDGSYRGNIIIDESGNHLAHDYHANFERRLDNYILGKNPIVIDKSEEIEQARLETLEILKDVFKKDGESVYKVIGRFRKMNEEQIEKLVGWMEKIKAN